VDKKAGIRFMRRVMVRTTIQGQITGLEILNRENGAILPLAHIVMER